MTLEEMNRAIAEVCGWCAVSVYEWKDGRQLPKQYHWDGFKATGLPNYTGSLDAIREALTALITQKNAEAYQRELYEVCMRDFRKNRMRGIGNYLWFATATQHAEALLRWAGRWQEKGEK